MQSLKEKDYFESLLVLLLVFYVTDNEAHESIDWWNNTQTWLYIATEREKENKNRKKRMMIQRANPHSGECMTSESVTF